MPNGKTNCFVDTNLLVYAIDPSDPAKHGRAADLVRRTARSRMLVLSPQSLNECYRVLVEKRRLARVNDIRTFIWSLSDFCTAPYDFDTTQIAWTLQDRYGLGFWDCMLLASASLARCDLFLSEDMRHEQTIGAMTILNPFRLDPGFSFSR